MFPCTVYREGQQDLHYVFIDLEKAYDRVPGKNCIGARETRVCQRRKYIRLVKDIYHQCETIVNWAAGISEPFAVEVGLHQGSTFSTFLFAIMMDSLTENIRKDAPWQMMFVDDVVLCAREKDVLKKLEVTEMKMCKWACGHTLRDRIETMPYQRET